ncbi:MAG: MAPEG family protein [Pseudomonadales bacterium]
MPAITLLWTCLFALFAIVLGALPGRMRTRLGVSVGDGGDRQLLLAMRRQANYLEMVPMALILMGLLELNGLSPVWLHGLAGTLFIARIAHAVGLDAERINTFGRVFGAAVSGLVIVGMAVWGFVIT